MTVAYIVKDQKPLVLRAHGDGAACLPVHEGAPRRLGPGDQRTAALKWPDDRSRVPSHQQILSLIVTLN